MSEETAGMEQSDDAAGDEQVAVAEQPEAVEEESVFERALRRLEVPEDDGPKKEASTTSDGGDDPEPKTDESDKPTHQKHNFDAGLQKLQKERAEDRKVIDELVQLVKSLKTDGLKPEGKAEPEQQADPLDAVEAVDDDDFVSATVAKQQARAIKELRAKIASLESQSERLKPVQHEQVLKQAKVAFESEYPGVSFDDGLTEVIGSLKKFQKSNPDATPAELNRMADFMMRQYGERAAANPASEQAPPKTQTVPSKAKPTAGATRTSTPPRPVPSVGERRILSTQDAMDKWLDDSAPPLTVGT